MLTEVAPCTISCVSHQDTAHTVNPVPAVSTYPRPTLEVAEKAPRRVGVWLGIIAKFDRECMYATSRQVAAHHRSSYTEGEIR